MKGFALDGKRLAGARRGDGSHVHLLSMVEQTNTPGPCFVPRKYFQSRWRSGVAA
jgi:hypothetical protein